MIIAKNQGKSNHCLPIAQKVKMLIFLEALLRIALYANGPAALDLRQRADEPLRLFPPGIALRSDLHDVIGLQKGGPLPWGELQVAHDPLRLIVLVRGALAVHVLVKDGGLDPAIPRQPGEVDVLVMDIVSSLFRFCRRFLQKKATWIAYIIARKRATAEMSKFEK